MTEFGSVTLLPSLHSMNGLFQYMTGISLLPLPPKPVRGTVLH